MENTSNKFVVFPKQELHYSNEHTTFTNPRMVTCCRVEIIFYSINVFITLLIFHSYRLLGYFEISTYHFWTFVEYQLQYPLEFYVLRLLTINHLVSRFVFKKGHFCPFVIIDFLSSVSLYLLIKIQQASI